MVTNALPTRGSLCRVFIHASTRPGHLSVSCMHSFIHPYVTRTDDVLTRTNASPINGFGVFTVTVSMQLNADPRWRVPLLLDARAASIVAGILTSAGAETEEDERYDEEEKEGEEGDEREEEDEREEDEEEGEAVPPPVQLQPPE